MRKNRGGWEKIIGATQPASVGGRGTYPVSLMLYVVTRNSKIPGLWNSFLSYRSALTCRTNGA